MKTLLKITHLLLGLFLALTGLSQAPIPSNPPTLVDLERDHPNGLYYRIPKLKEKQTEISAITDLNKQAKKQKRFDNKIARLYRFTTEDKYLKDAAEVLFVGNGNIQKSFSEGVSIPASTGVGVNYSEQWLRPKFCDFSKIELEGFINVASNVDTVKSKLDNFGKLKNASEFGGSILTPLNSGQAYSMIFRGYFSSLKLLFVRGVYVRYAAANRVWNYDKKSISTTLGSFRAGIFHEFLAEHLRENSSISVGVGFVYNSLRGDAELSSNNDFRKSILGTTKADFYGYEFNTMFRLKNIKAEFAYTHFDGSDNIPGLSGGRLVTTISFVGGFPLKLN